jgi:hypothetical protein
LFSYIEKICFAIGELKAKPKDNRIGSTAHVVAIRDDLERAVL